MTQFSIEASVTDGENDMHAVVVKRGLFSAVVDHGDLFLNNLGIRIPDGFSVDDGITVKLRITKTPGPSK